MVHLSQREGAAVGGARGVVASAVGGAGLLADTSFPLRANRFILLTVPQWGWICRAQASVVATLSALWTFLGLKGFGNFSDEKLSLCLEVIVSNLNYFFGGISADSLLILLCICYIFLHKLIERFILDVFDWNIKSPHSLCCLLVYLSLHWILENEVAHLNKLTIIFWSKKLLNVHPRRNLYLGRHNK